MFGRKEADMKKHMLATLAVLLLAGTGAAAQDALVATDQLPVRDGAIGGGEYQVTKTMGSVTVAASLGSDRQLYLAIQAKTSGWVALGTGSGRMDGASLFLAALQKGAPVLSEQLGKGHGHSDAPFELVSDWKLSSADGLTTLELVLPAAKVLSGSKLNLLWAYGNSSDLKSRHAGRGALSLAVAAP
jgi:hypothetical protein